jgi:hypothetical protein
LEVILVVKFVVSLKKHVMILSRFSVFRDRARSVVFLSGVLVFGGRARSVARSVTVPILPLPIIVSSTSASIDVYGFSGLLVGVRSDSKTITLLGAWVFCFTNSIFECLMKRQRDLMRRDNRRMSYVFELLLELIKLLSVNQACFIIDVFWDVEAAIFFVYLADDGFDRRITLDQGSFKERLVLGVTSKRGQRLTGCSTRHVGCV